jgi:hypothetical protein
MPTGHVFIGTSVDGFIARKDGGIEWLTGFSTLGEDHGFDHVDPRIFASGLVQSFYRVKR